MKILVTGATGFVGRSLIRRLLFEKHHVICLVRQSSVLPNELKNPKIEIRVCDLSNEDLLTNQLMDIDIVYHLAGSVFSKNRKELFAVNCGMTANLYFATRNTKVRCFIFMSSIAAVGPTIQRKKISETTIPRPISDYGRSKLKAEIMLLNLLPTVRKKIVIVRAPLVYGQGMNKESRLAILTSKILDRSFKFIGNGENEVSLCQIDNLISFFSLILKLDTSSYEIFHIADDGTFSIKELVSFICTIRKVDLPNKHISPFLALSMATVLSFFSKSLFSNPKILSSDQIKELIGNWVVDISKAKTFGHRPHLNNMNSLRQVILSF